MSPDSAETIALQALAWIAGNDELLPVFLGSTGASTEDIGNRVGDPAFLASVLEFLVLDDVWIRDFATSAGLPPELPLRALHSLPGAAPVHWT